jgi:predicted MFS family arabinose efflux permease
VQGLGRLLVVVGLIVAGVGVLMILGLPLGRLPGDIVIRREHTTIYVPLTSSVLLSLLATLLVSLLRR